MIAGVNTRSMPFSGPMTLAVLDDRKTQTRRVVIPQPMQNASAAINYSCGAEWDGEYVWVSGGTLADVKQISNPFRCPYGKPGDRLLVTEAHRWLHLDAGALTVQYEADRAIRRFAYDELPEDIIKKAHAYTRWGGFRAGRFLHHALSRIALEIVSVRLEQVQEIDDDDVKAEGIAIPRHDDGCIVKPSGFPARFSESEALYHYFAETWDAINAARGFAWDTHCWVWVVEFRRVQR